MLITYKVLILLYAEECFNIALNKLIFMKGRICYSYIKTEKHTPENEWFFETIRFKIEFRIWKLNLWFFPK